MAIKHSDHNLLAPVQAVIRMFYGHFNDCFLVIKVLILNLFCLHFFTFIVSMFCVH